MRPVLATLVAAAGLALAACATPSGQRPPAPEALFTDALFDAPTEPSAQIGSSR